MRKILLGTTAVVGAALMSMGVAQAQQAPTVRVGGYFAFAGFYIDDTADRNAVTLPNGTTTERQKVDFWSDAEIHVFVNGKAANGLSYGAVIELQVDNVGAGGPGTTIDTDEMYAFISSPTLGTLRFGDEDSAASIMQVRVPTVAFNGPDALWDEQIAGGQSYLVSGINDGNDATKIIYLSPQFFGFDFGVSYAPNAGEGERAFYGTPVNPTAPTGVASAQRGRTALQNEISGAVRYRGSFGNVGVAAGFGAMRADPQETTANLQDVTAYTAGLSLTGFGLTVGGEYTWGKYSGISTGRAPTQNGRDNSTNWAVGATYTIGATQIGAFYARGDRDSDTGALPGDLRQTLWGIGAVYTLAPGLELFGLYNSISSRNLTAVLPNGSRSQDIDFLAAGLRLAF